MTDPIWIRDRIIGYQITIDPNYDDLIVSFAHELYHAAAGAVYGYTAFKWSGGWLLHQEAYRRQNEVAAAFKYFTVDTTETGQKIDHPYRYTDR